MHLNSKISIPFILYVTGSFSKYIKSLSRNSKRWYNKCITQNHDLHYSQEIVSFDHIEKVTNEWTLTNRVEGHRYEWTSADYADLYYHYKNKSLLCYVARLDGNIICTQFTELHEDHVYCHAPLYNKQKYSHRNISKYMWFSLIRDMHNTGRFNMIDMGWHMCWNNMKDANSNWRDMLCHKTINYSKGSEDYKFLFLPSHVKQNPGMEKPLLSIKKRYRRTIVEL